MWRCFSLCAAKRKHLPLYLVFLKPPSFHEPARLDNLNLLLCLPCCHYTSASRVCALMRLYEIFRSVPGEAQRVCVCACSLLCSCKSLSVSALFDPSISIGKLCRDRQTDRQTREYLSYAHRQTWLDMIRAGVVVCYSRMYLPRYGNESGIDPAH